jgi:hypothetical protein
MRASTGGAKAPAGPLNTGRYRPVQRPEVNRERVGVKDHGLAVDKRAVAGLEHRGRIRRIGCVYA